MKMHEDAVETTADLVGRLVARQFPGWAGLPVRPVPTSGTDHALYRLGDDVVARLPRIGWALGQADKERLWLPRLGPGLPLAVPQPVAQGHPDQVYPWSWSVYKWLPGQSAAEEPPADPEAAAKTLAAFLNALQSLDTAGGPRAEDHGLRGAPLAVRDAKTREALASLAGEIDVPAALALWQAAMDAPASTQSVWFHGDLLPGNLLCTGGRLSAVIDWGGLGVGDPAVDLLPAWSLFDGEGRDAFRRATGADDAAWARGRGHALSQAALFLPYYRNTNPGGVDQAWKTLKAALADQD
jgi:aminoglycoside phosphotransferase (APT) family kinase protein